jgi:hypothetical protein
MPKKRTGADIRCFKIMLDRQPFMVHSNERCLSSSKTNIWLVPVLEKVKKEFV